MKVGDIFVYNFGAGSHRYVVIGKNASVPRKVLVVMATSKIQRREEFYKKQIADLTEIIGKKSQQMNTKAKKIKKSVRSPNQPALTATMSLHSLSKAYETPHHVTLSPTIYCKNYYKRHNTPQQLTNTQEKSSA